LVLGAVLLLVALAVPAAILMARGHLAISDTPRGWYVIYLAVLIALAILLAPFPRIAGILLALAAVEGGLGIGSLVLYKYRLIPSTALVPMSGPVFRFDWHPTLQAVPTPTSEAEARETAAINSDRTRGAEIAAGTLHGRIVVALFGGSTTFDAQSEGLSWPEQLQKLLGDRYAVINRGMGGYTTAEHVIQTAFYERIKGTTPNCSVYYVGWNDLRNAHTAGLDPGYANFHLPAQADVFRTRPTDLSGRSISPLAILAGRLTALAFDTIRADYPPPRLNGEPDPVLEAIFARNVATISAINRQRGIRTVWVGQLMNRAALTQDTSAFWLPLVPRKAVPGLIGRLNDILKREAARLGDAYVALPVEKLGEDGFIDEGHFSEEGSLAFARMMEPGIAENCR
jgi:lysophospholipase L1-like esterase